jgi:hypothetical protein
MTDQGREEAQEEEADNLLLDRIDALRVLRAETDEDKSRLLEEIGGHGKPEKDIVDELSKMKPLLPANTLRSPWPLRWHISASICTRMRPLAVSARCGVPGSSSAGIDEPKL